MPWTKVETKLIKLTKSVVNQMLSYPPTPGERPLREHHVEYLKTQLAKNTFRTPTWSTAFCEADGNTYRVNGQHTSFMFGEMGDLPDIKVNFETYYCVSREDVAELYATFDPPASTRSIGDINHMFSAVDPVLAELPKRLVDVCVTALATVRFGLVGAKRIPREERSKLMFDDKDFMLWVESIHTHSKSDPNLVKVPIAVAMFQSYKSSKVMAEDFWTKVRDGSSQNQDCPSRRLRDFILSTSVGGIGSARSKSINSKVYTDYCMSAWLAYRKGTMLKILKPISGAALSKKIGMSASKMIKFKGPLVCEICKGTFKMAAHLGRHMSAIHGVLPKNKRKAQ